MGKNEWEYVGDMWIEQALREAKMKLNEVSGLYLRLSKKTTTHAKSVKRLMVAREKVVKVWEDA